MPAPASMLLSTRSEMADSSVQPSALSDSIVPAGSGGTMSYAVAPMLTPTAPPTAPGTQSTGNALRKS